ncbi:hypothetical protein KJ657_01990 [Patescibacteria group bacterium]|nr:hypothetical protein [Patescibacteria group bacterium]MBU1015839.1 hypothetical protein [Patescibacteria group bacterium]MBU1685285.1 hypothetical protein [Patescibacteria group bacterium]MBU1938482.1 hypothetical protein [Patescibacteria group bacterium]
MKKLYLVSTIIVAVLILVLAFAQFGSTCVWYLIGTNTHPVMVLLWVAGLGAIMGGLLVLWWKTPKEGGAGSEGGDNEEEGSV